MRCCCNESKKRLFHRACFTAPAVELNAVPAEAFALLFRDFLDDGERLRPAVLAAGDQDGVHQRNRRGVRRAEGCGLHAGQEHFVAFARERGNVRVRDANAVGAVRFSQVHAFDSLPEAAAKADGQDEIVFVYSADEMGDAARRRSCKDGKAQQRDLILQIIGEDSGEISRENDDAARVIETLGERNQARGIETVLEAVQIFQVLLERFTNISGHAADATGGLHRVERRGEGDGEIVKMALRAAKKEFARFFCA